MIKVVWLLCDKPPHSILVNLAMDFKIFVVCEPENWTFPTLQLVNFCTGK